jgi:CubicO group peptidase (beta-lactamase class C family)
MRFKHLPFIIPVLLLVLAPARTDRVDDYIKGEMQKRHIPGLQLAVIKAGKTTKVAGYGLANVELNVPVKPETIFKIGSVSKQFIASGIMLLVDEGKVGLDDKISRYLEGTPETWKEITVRNLLTHTSAIVREAPGFNSYKIQSDADVIKNAYPLPLRFTPGEKWEYCNVGYFSLAEIIRVVSGKPWSQYLAQRIFVPVGMSSTRTTTASEIVNGRAGSYDWKDGRLWNADELIALRPSGAFLSNVLDLAKWDAALYTDHILKKSIREQMWTPVTLNSGKAHPYGFGWELGTINGHRLVHHGGSLSGFRSEFARYVDDQLSIVVLANCGDSRPEEIARGVAGYYIDGLAP